MGTLKSESRLQPPRNSRIMSLRLISLALLAAAVLALPAPRASEDPPDPPGYYSIANKGKGQFCVQADHKDIIAAFASGAIQIDAPTRAIAPFNQTAPPYKWTSAQTHENSTHPCMDVISPDEPDYATSLIIKPWPLKAGTNSTATQVPDGPIPRGPNVVDVFD